MKKFIKYNIKPVITETNENIAHFVIEPLQSGFGITIGNALRRTLLSNIPGASIFAIKIANINHEFQPIEGLKEDVTQVILNLKHLVLKIDDSVINDTLTIESWPTLRISKKEAGVIKASDIELPVGFDVVNKNLYIATKTDSNKKFDMEIYATTGRGFKTFKQNKEEINVLGIIATDSNFSPIIQVAYNVDEKKISKTEMGDVLTLDIATNGAISPTDALAYAAKILIDHFSDLANINEKIKELEMMEEAKKVQKQQSLSISINDLNLSERPFNCLRRQGIKTIKELLDISESEVRNIKNLGKKSFKEIEAKLKERGLKLKDDTFNDDQTTDNHE